MQFVPNGPDIPDALLQAHEDGRVVFFCGAGISFPAGLPGFKELVERIYQLNGTGCSAIEREAFDHERFDATLDLLERRLPGGRLAVRRALMRALEPKLRRRGAADTQAALLRLARDRKGALRLVTTNYDRVFHVAAKRLRQTLGQTIQHYAGPMLPIPKDSRWNGIVYLHGLLPKGEDATALNRLVVTSGDFGLAYLTEGWAARFLGELFRNYVVCFVGYSINDPVLRYMMDALAADRRLGEVTPQAWALGDCEAGQKNCKTEWEAKGVTPILYDTPIGSHDHSALHRTLQAWADIYRDGAQGKEAIVVKHAPAQPQNSTQQDDFVGRMLWALSDQSGLPAKRFAEFDPVPSLDWLMECFSDERFLQGDLSRFGVPPRNEVDAKLRFSLIQRPAPYDRAPRMLLVAGGMSSSRWDAVMWHLARWLVRHLNDPRLVIWIAQHGGQLHDRWSLLVEDMINDLSSKEREGKTAELEAIRSQAPNAIPGPLMRTLWGLLLSKRVRSFSPDLLLYRWLGRLKRVGLTTSLRLELREMLAPKVTISEPFRWGEEAECVDAPMHLRRLVDWKIQLTVDDVHSTLRDQGGDCWTSALPDLLDDFQQLLRDALDLMRELGAADCRSDPSCSGLPSITPHWQNRGFDEWVTLIELLRDAWRAVYHTDGDRATWIAKSWIELPYPAFKRLALFAASQDDCIPPGQWVDWLLANGAWWLWSSSTRREVFRLFVLQGRRLAEADQERLEAAILAGAPRRMYADDLTEDRWQDLLARTVWLRLAKLKASGVTLGASATTRLDLSTANLQLQLASNERDEFVYWTSGTGDPDYEESQDVDLAPRKRRDLVRWLRQPSPEEQPFHRDTWRDVCRRHLLNSLYALCDLAGDGEWPANRWREALQVWADEKMVSRSWRYAAPLMKTMPDDKLLELAHAATWWMEAASKSVNCHEDVLLSLCCRLLQLQVEAETGTTVNDGSIDNSFEKAINHPVGHVTRALINVWLKRKPKDGDGLPADILPFFTQICDEGVDQFRHGRALLGAHLIALFRVDRCWSERYLLPLFAWNHPIEAKTVWEGFLCYARLYQPLLASFKKSLLETANHYNELGEYRGQFAAFLTYALLETTEEFSVDEARSAMAALPQKGLERSAQVLSQALESAGDQSEDYFRNRVRPFWQNVWPKSVGFASPRMAVSLIRLAIAARGEFPVALAAVQDWLKPVEYPHPVLVRLLDSGLCSCFPVDALQLLDAVIESPRWALPQLGGLLNEIVEAQPPLAQDRRFVRLQEFSRGGGSG